MTATNHVLAGALVAIVIRQPLLAVPLAFFSHFVLDAIPHFGLSEKNVLTRNRQRIFWRVLAIDMLLACIAMITVPLLLNWVASWWVIVLCMGAAALPDLVWGYRLYFEKINNVVLPKSLFSRFHSFIQTSETPMGLAVEVIWLVLVVELLVLARTGV